MIRLAAVLAALRRRPSLLALAAYLVGLTWYLAVTLEGAMVIDAPAALWLAPVTLVVAPWVLLGHGLAWPLLLTYGVFAAWRVGRAVLATVRPPARD